MDSISILEEIQNQNRFVYKKLFDDFYEELVLYANGYLFDKSPSEDIVQEVFIYLWEKSDSIIIQTSLKGYMYAMVRNRCLNFLKSIKITDDVNILELRAAVSEEYNLDAFSDSDKKAIHAQVIEIIEALPSRMQAIVRLRFVSNYRYSEIADELGVSVNTVKTQLKRAKIKIGELIVSIIVFLSTYLSLFYS
ncbi:RNA polymerase sigma-70 factor [Flagellimonas pacifica]|uniref:RNA polymerase sigma-70 factor, ECF subfamily n=1 Tax=Flagellimonas pacifica TaxID=1247520 RepID=A0A285MTC7_9FLAO|nr:RNA polymerase sigma-70 factor [Allomuricauda parva]SNZ00445.1 RNA polymerase sigma-70 factor, ECF subfamily [Allomuricauda parva]